MRCPRPLLAIVSLVALCTFISLLNSRASIASGGDDKPTQDQQADADHQVAKTEKKRTDANAAQADITRLERQLAESYLDRGLRLCDEGEAGRGSLWMARALTVSQRPIDN